MKSYKALYCAGGEWIHFTVLAATDAYHAFNIAREIVGPNIGLAVFGDQT